MTFRLETNPLPKPKKQYPPSQQQYSPPHYHPLKHAAIPSPSQKYSTTTIKNGIRNLVNTFRIYCKKCLTESHILSILSGQDILSSPTLYSRRSNSCPSPSLQLLLEEIQKVIPPKMFYNNMFFMKVEKTRLLKGVLLYWIVNMGEYCMVNLTHVKKEMMELYRVLIEVIEECLKRGEFKSIYKMVKKRTNSDQNKREVAPQMVEQMEQNPPVQKQEQSQEQIYKVHKPCNLFDQNHNDPSSSSSPQPSLSLQPPLLSTEKPLSLSFTTDLIVSTSASDDKSHREEIDDLQVSQTIQWPMILQHEEEEYSRFFTFAEDSPVDLGNVGVQLSTSVFEGREETSRGSTLGNSIFIESKDIEERVPQEEIKKQ